jgi:hypothetical protein
LALPKKVEKIAMETVIAIFKLKDLDLNLEPDTEMILSKDQQIETAKRHIVSMILAAGGRELGEHGGDLVMEVPLDQSNIIREVHNRLVDDLEISTTIGVGDNPQDAKKALNWALKNRPESIKVMEPTVDENWHPEEESRKSPSVAIGEDTVPEAVHKAEDKWADPNDSITDESKQKMANIVQMLSTKKQYLDGLKQSNPEVYAGVVALVQSLSAMAQKAKESDAKDHHKMISKISQHLDNSSGAVLDEEVAKVLEELVEAQELERAKSEKKAEMMKRHSMNIHKRDDSRPRPDDGYDDFGYKRLQL